MKVPLTIEIPDPPKPDTNKPQVYICFNDGKMLYDGWDGLIHEALNHSLHTCTMFNFSSIQEKK